jgi:phage portal protein BeeE
MFGVPARFLNVETTTRTYSNLESESIDMIRYTASGDLQRFEQALSNLLPRGTWVKANLDSLLRPDTEARYRAHKIGLDANFLTIDEVRDLEDLPPLPRSDSDLDSEEGDS